MCAIINTNLSSEWNWMNETGVLFTFLFKFQKYRVNLGYLLYREILIPWILILLLLIPLKFSSALETRSNALEKLSSKITSSTFTTYDYTGSIQTITIPSDFNSMMVTLYAASGAIYDTFEGGAGAVITATIPVSPGEQYQLFIGGVGIGVIGGFNGGGAGSSTTAFSRAGGGATDLRKAPFSLQDRILVAGGGGGASGNSPSIGGAGGYPAGAKAPLVYGAPGGTQTQGGYCGYYNTGPCLPAGQGSFGLGGNAGFNTAGASFGGAGGGGYYGGGGAGGGGGGGGSSYSLYPIISTAGTNTGNGYATIEYFISTTTPTNIPITVPTAIPNAPTAVLTVIPTITPTDVPSSEPTAAPTTTPTTDPSAHTALPTTIPPTTSPPQLPINVCAPYTDNGVCSVYACPSQIVVIDSAPGTCVGDQYLVLWDLSGARLAYDDDSDTGLCSRLTHTFPNAGSCAYYSLEERCYSASRSCSGAMQISFVTAAPSKVPTYSPTAPTAVPTFRPTAVPTSTPTAIPSAPTAVPTVVPTDVPSIVPTAVPTTAPTAIPSAPTSAPTTTPSVVPTTTPSAIPTTTPSAVPTTTPSAIPTATPSAVPTTTPSVIPTTTPSAVPTATPSAIPTATPSAVPTTTPSAIPTATPSAVPTTTPSAIPTTTPSAIPTTTLSAIPTTTPSAVPTTTPSAVPTTTPSAIPTVTPSAVPTATPSVVPTATPSVVPTTTPSAVPTTTPSAIPTTTPSVVPTTTPSAVPTATPSAIPSTTPSAIPTTTPSAIPTTTPSAVPTATPSAIPSTTPSVIPTTTPSAVPTATPSVIPSTTQSTVPTVGPTITPTTVSTSSPSKGPTQRPTASPSTKTSVVPTGAPTFSPTCSPTIVPSCAHTVIPTVNPTTASPSCYPTITPTCVRTSAPTSIHPSGEPSPRPSSKPSSDPTWKPSAQPSSSPSTQPSSAPSVQPSGMSTVQPSSAQSSTTPSSEPSMTQPTNIPSLQSSSSAPSVSPSILPSSAPSARNSDAPTLRPTTYPSSQPSRQPTSHPSLQPSTQLTSVPSSKPTSSLTSRTQRPTASPTRSPTLSELSAWSSKLQESLIEVSKGDTSTVAHRSTYYELDVVSTSPSRIFGGCSTWTTRLTEDLIPSQYIYKATSLKLSMILDIDSYDNLQTHKESAVTCEDPSVTANIVNALLASPKSGSGVQNARNFLCGTLTWVVRQCVSLAGSYSAGVCVGCADPCSSALHCNSDIRAPQINADVLSVAPCVPQVCPGSSSISTLSPATAIRILSVAYVNIEKAPTLRSVTEVSSQTAIRLNAQLSSAGSLYWAVYKTTTAITAPTSTSVVQLQNLVGVTDSNNATSVVVSGLDAASSYHVFAMAVSPIGVQSTLEDVLSSLRVVHTSCCKTLTSSLSTISVIEQQAVINLLSVSLDSLPSFPLTVRINLFAVSTPSGSITQHSTTMFPAVLSFTAQSASATLRVSLPAMSTGLYEYNLTLTGLGAVEYEVVYTSGLQRFEVISSVQEPPIPTLSQAIFSNDGSHVVITFSTNTNRGGVATTFTCSTLFSFACAVTSRCQWTNAATVRAFIQGATSSEVCAAPGLSELLQLSPGAAIKAACQTSNGICIHYKSWQTISTAASVVVQAPSSPITPTVSISTPSVLGGCDDLLLDASGSTGSGGRAWTNSSIMVVASPGNDVTALRAHLQSIVVLTPPPVIPSRLFAKGQTYNLKVELCNFLGQCNVGSRQVLVLNDTMPSVSLLGPALRTCYRKNALSLSSSAFMTTCGGSRSSVGFSYKWSVSVDGTQLLNVPSTSKDPAKFLLPAFSLSSGSVYKVTLTASSIESGRSALASTQVYVQPGAVVANIWGGSARTMRVSDELVLDASLSADEDLNGVTGVDAGFRFAWGCVQIAPQFVSSCDGVFDADQLANARFSAALTLNPLHSAAGTSAKLTVDVSDSANMRFSKASVSVSVLADLAPVVSVEVPNLDPSGVVNAGRLLQLRGILSVPASMGGNATWIVDDPSIVLEKIALFPLTVTIPASNRAASAATISAISYMAFPSNSLPIDSTLTFSLVGAIPFQDQRAVGSISVVVNGPPTSGSFYVDPDSGPELQQSFLFLAMQWVDSDLPISYQFSYISNDGLDVVLRSRLEIPYGATLLSAGKADKQYAVTCKAQIFDALNANSSARFNVEVTKQVALDLAQVESFIAKQVSNAATDVDSIKQAMAMSSYLLNSANCTLAPNCSERHRRNCVYTAHTCGSCESDLYVGEDGDSNDYCVSLLSPVTPVFNATLNFALSSGALKACAANCSGHGACYHVARDSRQVITKDMSPCLAGDIDCLAICDCEPDYYGSDTCDVSTADFKIRQGNRETVIIGLQTLIGLENADEQVIEGWVNSVVLTSQVSSELTETSTMAVLSLVDTITASTFSVLSSGNIVSSVSLKGLLSALNSVAEARTKADMRRRLRAIRHLSGDNSTATTPAEISVSATLDALNNFGNLLAQSMLPGQAALNFSEKEFRLAVQVLTGNSSAEEEVSVLLPQSSLEKYLGVPATQVLVPAAEGVTLVTSSVRSEQYDSLGANFQSHPILLHVSDEICPSSPCTVRVVMQNSNAINFAELNRAEITEIQTLECAVGDLHTRVFECRNGEMVSITCSGAEQVLQRQCPVVTFASACGALSSTATELLTGKDSDCKMLSFTDTKITCECDIYNKSPSYLSRHQLNGGYNLTAPAGYSVSYVAMLEASVQTFLTTARTADGLDAGSIRSGWRALTTLGTLGGAILIALFLSNNADYKMKKIAPSDGFAKASGVSKDSSSKVKQAKGRKIRFNTRAKKALVNAELAIVEESLPRALSSRTLSDRFLEEVKQHHRWFGIVFYYSDAFPRVLRVMSLATNAIVMLFIQSITYNLTNPDDGSCALLKTEEACLVPQSPFATGESMCGWATSTIATEECVYIEPDQSVRIILFVAIFCAVVTTPIALVADWMMLNILSAPTLGEAPAENALTSVTTDSLLVSGSTDAEMHTIVPASGSAAGTDMPVRGLSRGTSHFKNLLGFFSDESKAKEEEKTLALCKVELMLLASQLQQYRASLAADELEEFNTLWGLDAEGKFLTGTPIASSFLDRARDTLTKKNEVNVCDAILMDLKRIHNVVRDEASVLQETDTRKHEIGKKLLFLFQCDLLPGISGKILELKGNRDSSKVKHVSVRTKLVAWAFLLLMNVGMLFYILLFALTQTGPRQNAWFQSFALWLVVEILLVSTAIVFITHILVPALIMKDITQIKRRLMDNIRDFNDKVNSEQPVNKKGIAGNYENAPFNAANYLFVSTRLARQFPDFMEAKIIAQFSTPWPRQSYLHIQNVSKKYSKKFSAFTRSMSILLIFFLGNFLSVPPVCQDIIVQMTCTTAIGYLVLVHVQLFEIFPALVILPALVVVVVAHFIIQSSKADAKIRLARLFPSKNRRIQPALPLRSYRGTESKENSEPSHTTALRESYGGSVSSGSEEEEAVAEAPVPVTTSTAHRTRRQSIQTGLDLLHTMHTQRHHVRQLQSAVARTKCRYHQQMHADESEDESSGSSSGDESRDYTSTEEEVAATAADSESIISVVDADSAVVKEEGAGVDDLGAFHTALGTPFPPIQTLTRRSTPTLSPSASLCVLSSTMSEDQIGLTTSDGRVRPSPSWRSSDDVWVSSESEYSNQEPTERSSDDVWVSSESEYSNQEPTVRSSDDVWVSSESEYSNQEPTVRSSDDVWVSSESEYSGQEPTERSSDDVWVSSESEYSNQEPTERSSDDVWVSSESEYSNQEPTVRSSDDVWVSSESEYSNQDFPIYSRNVPVCTMAPLSTTTTVSDAAPADAVVQDPVLRSLAPALDRHRY